MGVSLGTEGRKQPDIAFNLVPFIDLMSCLTAFLLVAAVWVKTAQLDVSPQGKARAGVIDPDHDEVVLSVLVQHDRIWVSPSRVHDEMRSIDRAAAGDLTWAELKTSLDDVRRSAWFEGSTKIEIAAESGEDHPVLYQDLISVMETARAAGFVEISVTDRDGLTTTPTL